MKNKQIPIIALAVFSIIILLAQNNLPMVFAISTVTKTYTTGTIIRDVSYDKTSQGSNDAVKYTTGLNGSGGVVFKMGTGNTFLANQTLAGSTVGRAIEYNHNNLFVYVASNDKIWKLTNNLGIAGSFATGTSATIFKLFYDDIDDTMYFCFNDGYGTINLSTLSPTTLYTDAGVNSVLGCSFDSENNFAYLTGDNIGTASAFNIIRINLNTHVVINGVSIGTDFFQENCLDDVDNNVWAVEPSNARVRKYDSALTELTTITVGTTPRGCSINTDDTGRRLYVSNEGTDNVSIVDIDANTIISTVAVCNVVGDRYIDTKRLANTTQTYIACSANINTIINDDSVSSFVPIEDDTIGGINCNLPENANILICRLGGDGTLGSAGAFVIGNVSAGTGFLGIGCSIGLVDCTEDQDPRSNGLGLLIFIASIFVIVGIFYRSLGAGATFQLPVFIWVIIIVALSAFFTITNIIDPIFLILSVIAVIALAVPKVIGMIQSRGFGGGSSE